MIFSHQIGKLLVKPRISAMVVMLKAQRWHTFLYGDGRTGNDLD